MVELRVLTLGAGQDVGRSCVVVNIGGRNIMFDCGMHMGYQDERRYPDFKMISRNGNYTQAIDAVIVTHFHLDHCGALPFFTEVCGYSGPIYMTYPTKAIVPVMLEDFHKVLVDRRGEGETFSRKGISDCMRKVTAVDLHETVRVAGAEDIELRAYYAGHVLGAAMFYVRVGNESVVYTGDYNMTPDRHLGAAQIERLRPDLLITETTYATTIRDSKRARERDFLTQVHETVEKGGKVLIPVFAVGRAQELCILLDEYWERMNLDVPIYLSAGMTAKANMYYKLLVNWTSEKIKGGPAGRNAFGFTRMRQWERGFMDRPGPCVLFATPGMLHGGTSLEVFKAWAPGEQNMVILPGYCVAGTVGSKLMASSGKILDVDKRTKLNVACKVRYLSFSAHADAKGIMGLIQQCAPSHVMLVHGEQQKMEFLSKKISKTFRLRVFMPPNGTVVTMRTSGVVPVAVSRRLVSSALLREQQQRKRLAAAESDEAGGGKAGPDYRSALISRAAPVTSVPVEGLLLCAEGPDGTPSTALMAGDEVAPALGVTELKMSFGAEVEVHRDPPAKKPNQPKKKQQSAKPLKKRRLQQMEEDTEGSAATKGVPTEAEVLDAAAQRVRDELAGAGAEGRGAVVVLEPEESSVCVESFRAILIRKSEEPPLPGRWEFSCSWLKEHDKLAQLCLTAMAGLSGCWAP